MKVFLKRLPSKLWLLLIAAVFFTFFSNDFSLVDIEKTAIVLAVGIDREEDGFALTAQIAVPKGSDRTAGGTSSVEPACSGATVADCLADLHAKTGRVPKLVFCDLVLLGESTTAGDVFDCLDYFLRNEHIPDSCRLAACEGSAGELLASASAIDDTSALALGKLFSDAAQSSGQVMPVTLREFAIGYYGVSRSGYMPYVRAHDEEGEQASGEQQGGAQSGQGGSEGQNEAQKLYSARETALFFQGRLTGILPPEETLAFSLLESNVYAGTFACDGKTYIVLRDKGSVSLSLQDVPSFTLALRAKVQRSGESETAPPEALAKGMLSPAEEERVSQELTARLQALWERCARAQCDLLLFRRTLRRASLAAYGKWKDVPLASLHVTCTARAESLK